MDIEKFAPTFAEAVDYNSCQFRDPCRRRHSVALGITICVNPEHTHASAIASIVEAVENVTGRRVSFAYADDLLCLL